MFRNSATLCATGGLITLSSFAGASETNTLYDSGGFESDTFLTGFLVGQDGFAQFGVDTPTGTGTSVPTVHDAVIGGPIKSGDQAVTFTRNSSDGLGATSFVTPLDGSSLPQEQVVIEFDLYVASTLDQDPDPVFESIGPVFAVDVFSDAASAGTPGIGDRILSVGVETSTVGNGPALFVATNNDPLDADFLLPDGVDLPLDSILLDQYQNWVITVDIPTSTYSVAVDSLLLLDSVALIEFVDFGTGEEVQNVSFLTFASDAFLPDVEGVAYLDNYSVIETVVPEPSSLVLIGLAGTCFLLRKKR